MGNIYRLKCENGDYEKILNLGSGMVYPGYNGGFSAAFCRKCNDYTRVMVNYDRNNEVTEGAQCCGTREGLDLTDMEAVGDKGLTCPVCGKKIEVIMDGFWD